MDSHLSLVNALIGLALGAPRWPRTLADHTYDLYWVAPRFSLSTAATLNPDLIFHSTVRNHALVVEAKGGASLSSRQLNNARDLTVDDLVGAGVGFPDRKSAQATYAVACFSHAQDEILQRLEDGHYTYPLLCFGSDNLRLIAGTLADPLLAKTLHDGVPLPKAPFPAGFIPFDGRSTLEEVAASVIVFIIRELSRETPHFRVEDVLSRAIPVWDRFHMAERRQMINAAVRVIDRMRKTRGTEFRHVIRDAATATTPHLYMITNKVPKQSGYRLIRYETLHGWASRFMESIGGKPLPPVRPRPDEGTQGAFWTESAP